MWLGWAVTKCNTNNTVLYCTVLDVGNKTIRSTVSQHYRVGLENSHPEQNTGTKYGHPEQNSCSWIFGHHIGGGSTVLYVGNKKQSPGTKHGNKIWSPGTKLGNKNVSPGTNIRVRVYTLSLITSLLANPMEPQLPYCYSPTNPNWIFCHSSTCTIPGLFNPRTRAHIVCRKSWPADRKFNLKIPHFWVEFVSL